MFHWLSDDVVRFKIKVGVEVKTLNTHKMAIAAAWCATVYINMQCFNLTLVHPSTNVADV